MMDIKKLDEIDQQILALLVENSNIAYAEIARNLELSRAAITKRVNALIAEGVISRFTVNIDPKKLELDIIVLFEISTLPAKTRDIMEELSQYGEVGEILLTGTASIFAFAYLRDIGHLNEFMMHSISRMEGVQEIKTNVLLGTFSGKSLIGSKRC
ncbi:MAG: Lrp/AsnC family transcriptional regulator [Bacillota bacterium]